MAIEIIRKQMYGDENKNIREECVENIGYIDNKGKFLSQFWNITIKNY